MTNQLIEKMLVENKFIMSIYITRGFIVMMNIHFFTPPPFWFCRLWQQLGGEQQGARTPTRPAATEFVGEAASSSHFVRGNVQIVPKTLLFFGWWREEPRLGCF